MPKPTRAALIVAALLSSAALAAPPADPPPPPAEESAAEDEALPLLPEAEAPPVARDVGIEELPLLVTEPDAETEAAPTPAPVLGGNDSTLNPFSPLLLPQAAPPNPPQPAPAQPTPPTPPTVAAPAEPPPAAPPAVTADPRPAAPLPEARTGSAPLPRSLTTRLQPSRTPSAELSAAVLGRALGTGTLPPALGPAAELAAVRAPTDPAPLGSRSSSGAQRVARGYGLAVMGLGGNEGNFTSSGSNRVSRALGTLQVSFTAMATGTGIFRVGDAPTPVLLAPGEALPGTQLVLTRLTDRGAQFTEDDVRHTLFLNP